MLLILYFYNLHLWKLVFKTVLTNGTVCLLLTLPWLVDFICEFPRNHTLTPNIFLSAPQVEHGSFGVNSVLCLDLCLHSFFFIMDSLNDSLSSQPSHLLIHHFFLYMRNYVVHIKTESFFHFNFFYFYRVITVTTVGHLLCSFCVMGVWVFVSISPT